MQCYLPTSSRAAKILAERGCVPRSGISRSTFTRRNVSESLTATPLPNQLRLVFDTAALRFGCGKQMAGVWLVQTGSVLSAYRMRNDPAWRPVGSKPTFTKYAPNCLVRGDTTISLTPRSRKNSACSTKRNFPIFKSR